MAGGTPLGNMVIKLGLDDADFGKGVANSKKQVTYLAKEMQANMKIADMAGNQLGKLGTKYESLSKIIKAQENQVAALKKAYDESFVDGKATESTKRLAAQLQDANGKLANYKTQLQNTAGQLARMQVETQGVTGWLNKQGDALIKQGEKIQKFGSGVSKVGTALTVGVTAPLVAGATAVTKAAISWESAFAGVKKTSDEIVDKNGKVVYSYDDLESSLRGLAKELPSTHSEIAAVAEAAGQLGIQTDNVAAFTKVMIDLGESTNMGAETAATELARFANITQMSQDKFSNLGSAIVDLGNNFATTESEISAMALRLAGAGSQIGMSEGDIVGFAAALSSVGIEAEAGGSAFSKVMVNMQLAAENGMGSFDELIARGKESGVSFESMTKAVQDGGKNLKSTAGEMGLTSKQLKAMYKEADDAAISLQQFAEVAGMTNSEFGNLFKESPAEAIMAFVEGLAHAEEQGKSAIAVLDGMDIKEVRLRDSLLRAANASGVFADAVGMGNKAFGENTALAEEAGKRYETTESKLKMLKNEVADAAIEFGGPFVDALRNSVEQGKPLVEWLGNTAKAFNELEPEQQQNILKWVGIVAAIGPVVKILGTVLKAAGATEKGIGLLSKSIVKIAANSAEKKALATFATSVTGVGTAASGAAGSAGVGALTTALGTGGLAGALPLIVGAGGLLAVGYGAWKLFGEEAWNSSQRVQRWGTDVGEVVDTTLQSIQSKTNEASGQFGVMADGFSIDSDSMVANFEKIGQTIEKSLVKKVEGLDQLLKELPKSMDSSISEMIQDEKENSETALKTVQENTQRISDIKKQASSNDRELSVSEAKIIQGLAKNTTQAYVDTLDVSAGEKKKILSAMNADVANATEEEAKLWLQSLGKQRQIAQQNATLSRQEKEKYLEDLGYNLDGEFAKKFLSAWDEINTTTVQGFDSQMETILKKYPELQNEVSLANGQLISSMGDYADSAIAENEKILKSTSDLSRELASNAEKNAEKLSWTASESSKAGKLAAQTWNDLVFDEKTGEVKSNVAKVVTEATKDSTTWNNLKLVVHDADLDSNAKDVVGEAAIANGWWDGMAWSDKKAILDDEFSQTMFKALEDSGKWEKMTFDEKKAFLYSNTPEVMSETMLQLGLWDEFQPQVKDLKADNYELLNALSFSKTSLNEYNALDPEIKRLIAEDPATITVEQSKKMLQTYNNLSPELKRLLGENTNVNAILTNSKGKINDYNATKVGPKHLHATADYSEVLRAKSEIAQVYSKNVVIDVEYRGRRTGQTAIANATGTNYHPGGDMIVNDQSGPLYKELVQFPGQTPFIPEGRNVYIENAPKGTKVLRASLAKALVPRYANGVGTKAAQTATTNKLLDLKVDFNTGVLSADKYKKSLNSLTKTAKLTSAQMRTVRTELARISSISEKTIEKTQKLNSNLTSVNNKYLQSVQKINSQLKKDIAEAQKEYQDHLKQTESTIYSQIGLFDRATTKLYDKTYLKDNLKSQVDQMKLWTKDIDALSKNAPKAFVEELREMGVGSAGEASALAQMSKSELDAYVKLWSEKHSLSSKEAVKQSTAEKSAMEKEVAALNKAAITELNKATAEWKTNLIKYKATTKELAAFKNNGSLVGKNVADGLINGLKGMSGPLSTQSKAMANSIIKDMKKTLGIHSPSKVAENEIGAMLPAGVIEGIEKNKKLAFGAFDGMVQTLKNKIPYDNSLLALDGLKVATGVYSGSTGSTNYQDKFDSLINIMQGFSEDLKNLQVQAVVDGNSFNKKNAPYQSSQMMKRTKKTERGLAIDVQI